ncbi:MAG: TrkA C-terminal domain-containing protein [Acidimicrobiia bacterium]
MIAVASLLVLVIIILLVARVATVALMATGLPTEVARLQARSMLTGVGYTTGESESIVTHPVRRRIAMILMLVGNVGLVSLLASVMLSFATSATTGQVMSRFGVMIAGLLAIFLLIRTRIFEHMVTRLIARVFRNFADLELRDFHHLMQLSRDYAVTELQVRPEDWLAERTLSDLELPDEGVLVLAVQRADGDFLGAPRGRTVVHRYDTLVLYGRAEVLADLDIRPASPSGDHAHAQAVAEHEGIVAEQEDDDEREEPAAS